MSHEHDEGPPGNGGGYEDEARRRWRERRAEWERDREARRREGRERRREGRHARKERVLHTRISEQLLGDIRELADDLRVPVSNLVRNVLEEAFSVAQEVGDDVGALLEDVLDEAERASERFRGFQERRRRERAEREERGEEGFEDERGEAFAPRPQPAAVAEERRAFADVVAWQPVVLNAPQRCARTGREMRAGEDAFLGLTAAGLSGIYLSREGLDSLR